MSVIEAETIEFIKGQSRPSIAITWKDRTGAIIDFSTGFTPVVKIGEIGVAAVATIASVTLAATAPNVILNPTVAELAALVVGETYILQVSIASASQPRIKQWKFHLLGAVLP